MSIKMTLEERTRRLEDRQAIEELNARYFWHAARGESEQIAACFVAEGIYDSRLAGASYRAEGYQDLVRHFDRVMKPSPAVILSTHNHITEFDGDHASGTCVLDSAIGGRLGGGFVGYYRDRYRLENGQWLFVERIYDNYAEFPALPGTQVKPAPAKLCCAHTFEKESK